ncbi:MAG: hypothetical protein ABIW50_04820 [Candidatus Limnocylindria bacterium]
MEGYSVTEAASVLGVPTERVWELLARGVLSGAPEGETGMRVYLQPRPAPAAPVAERPRTNGHGDPAKAEAEASPFRELLTEFRNLTERYGQALLALGEARGEVASLRSRVDVLEARMDLRLPFGGSGTAPPPPARQSITPPRESTAQAATPPQPASAPAEPHVAPDEAPAIELEGDSGHESETEHEPQGDRSARRRRTRAQFVEDFAEALARAEDPNPAELPGSVEAGAAFAALQAVVAPDSEIAQVDVTAADAGLPRELPAAEPMIDTETEPEPEPAPELLAEPEPEPAPELPAEPEAEPEPEWPAEPEPQPDGPLETPAARDDDPRVEAETPATAEPDPEPDPQSAGSVEPESSGPAEASIEIASESVPSEPSPSWNRDRYTTVIEEPDWWTPDAAGWDDPLPDPASAPVAADASTVAPITEPDDRPATDQNADAEADAEAEGEPQTAETAQPIAEQPQAPAPDAPDFAASMGLDAPLESEDAATEETMLWFGSRPDARVVDDAAAHDAAAEMEIASTGRQSMPGNDRSTQLPGAGELDEALAALAAHSGTPPDAGPSQADSEPSPPEPSAPRPAAPAQRVERARPVDIPSPASRAYRRLRRIFPN